MSETDAVGPTLLGVERTGDGWRFALRVPADSPLFDGHFPGHAVLPGVAQLHWAYALYAAHSGDGRGVGEVRRAKFRRLVHPDDRLDLRCVVNGNTLRFDYRRILDASEEEVSSAHLVLLDV